MSYAGRQYGIIKKILTRNGKVDKMIKNQEKLQKLEKELVRKENVDVLRNFRLIDAMYKEAVALNIFPTRDTLSGIEIDIKIAKVINSVSESP